MLQLEAMLIQSSLIKLYIKVVQVMPLILVLYVNDLFLKGLEPLIIRCKRELASEFEMKYLGLMHFFLGLEFWQMLFFINCFML